MRLTQAKVVLAAAIVAAVLVAPIFIWHKMRTPAPIPAPSVSASSSASVSPSVASSGEAPPELSQGDDILSHASYDHPAHCLLFSSRSAQTGDWLIPYPNRVVITSKPTNRVETDCGFFPTIRPDGWRLAYCLETGTESPGTKRVARKLYLRNDNGKLAVQIDRRGEEKTAQIYAGFFPGKCP